MATFLHRLGAWVYDHRRTVVAVWLVILLTIGGLAATFMGKLSNTFTIPGTETERVMDLMAEELPDLASGTGSVVFVTQNGEPFTEQQQEAVENAVQKIDSLPSVRFATNPFAMQARLDESAVKIAEGEEELATNEVRLEEAADQIADGRSQIAVAQAQIEAAEASVSLIEQQLAALDPDDPGYEDKRAELEQALGYATGTLQYLQGTLYEAQQGLLPAEAALAQLDLAQAKLNEAASGYQILSAQESQVVAGRLEIAAALQQIDAGQQEVNQGKAQALAARNQLDEAAAQIRAGEAELAAGKSEYEKGRFQYEAGLALFESKEADLIAGENALADGQRQLEDGNQRLADSREELAAGEVELAEGNVLLEEGRAELERGSRLAALSTNMLFVAQNRIAAMAQISFMGQTMALTEADRQELFETVGDLPGLGVDAFYSSDITSDLNSVVGVSEVIGFLIAALVLFYVLGTLLAAGLPLLVALVGVAIGVGGTLALSSLIDMQSITPVLALMLGLAVGIDYSLFIVHRHKTQLLSGMPVRDSVAKAVATSGSAVVFAGLTVVIALSALVVPGLPFLSILGLSAAFTVLTVVLLSITLTPALLGFLGDRLLTKKANAQRLAAVAESEVVGDEGAQRSPDVIAHEQSRASSWWARVVTSHAPIAAGLVVLILGMLAVPAAFMQTALPDGSTEPEGSDGQRSFEVISSEFGEGFNGPLLIMAELPEGVSQEEADDAMLGLAEEVSQIDWVLAAVPAVTNETLTYGALQIIPPTGPSSPETVDLVHDIRGANQDLEQTTGMDTAVAGMVAAQIDISQLINAALAPYLLIVVGLSLLLLLIVFRSLAIPLLATVGFLRLPPWWLLPL